MLYYIGGLLCSKSKSLILIYSFWVHFVRNTSLYFWNLRKILRLLIPINPTYIVKNSFLTHMYGMTLKVYTCQEAASGPKTFLNTFCKLLQQNESSPAWQWSWFQHQLTLLNSIGTAVLWIRTHFFRIRIHKLFFSDSDTDSDTLTNILTPNFSKWCL
jgi:hypothetical protein